MGDISEQLQALFREIKEGFRAVDREEDPENAERRLKELGGKLTDCKRIIREFEKQARADGMDQRELQKKKTEMVVQLNKHVAMRKKKQESMREKEELLKKKADVEAAKKDKGKGKAKDPEQPKKPVGGGQDIYSTMSTQELMTHGRRTMAETDKSLSRGLQVVNDTIAVGQQTTKALQEQGMQLEKIGNDLDEITFSMQKATAILKDMTRQMATDKCIMGFLLLIIGGIVTIVVLKVLKVKIVKDINISVPLPTSTSSPPPTPPAARRLLTRQPLEWTAGDVLAALVEAALQ